MPNKNEPVIPKRSHTTILILFVVLATALVIGGIVYAWQQVEQDKAVNEKNAQIQYLESLFARDAGFDANDTDTDDAVLEDEDSEEAEDDSASSSESPREVIEATSGVSNYENETYGFEMSVAFEESFSYFVEEKIGNPNSSSSKIAGYVVFWIQGPDDSDDIRWDVVDGKNFAPMITVNVYTNEDWDELVAGDEYYAGINKSVAVSGSEYTYVPSLGLQDGPTDGPKMDSETIWNSLKEIE